MENFTQHYKIIKDCLLDFCRCIAATITRPEIDLLVGGTIVSQVPVRTSVLQAIATEIDLTDLDFSEEIWLAYHDDVDENIELARAIWDENGLEIEKGFGIKTLPYLESTDKHLRRAAARAVADSVERILDTFVSVLAMLQDKYREKAKPRVPELDEYGMPKRWISKIHGKSAAA
jgi:hypothetical protein